MKSTKLTIVFSVLAVSTVLCLWAAGIIGQAEANDTMKRLLMIVGILGFTSTVIFLVFGSQKTKENSDSSPNSGPKF